MTTSVRSCDFSTSMDPGAGYLFHGFLAYRVSGVRYSSMAVLSIVNKGTYSYVIKM